MDVTSLKLIIALNADAFHPDGWRYDPIRKRISRMGHEPGMDPYSKEVYSWPVNNLPELDEVPKSGWKHMPGCECDDCVKGEHVELLPDGGYRIVTRDGVIVS